MNHDNLVRMANRIGDFFESMPDRSEAIEGIATHIKKFWDPRMRKLLLEVLDNGGGEMKDIVRTAVERHRGLLA